MTYQDLRVLLADDVSLMHELLRSILSSFKCTNIVHALDGDAAVSMYKTHRPDITLLDINMPRKDGLQVLREILDINPSAFVVMVSGESTLENVQGALKAGAKGFIVKPYSSQRLLDILNKYLNTRK